MIKSQNFTMKIPWQCCVFKNIANRRYLVLFLVIFLLLLPNGRLEKLLEPQVNNLNSTLYQNLLPTCPKILPKVFSDQAPRGNNGVLEGFVEMSKDKTSTSLEDCVEQCCSDVTCQMVFVFRNNTVINCYHTKCTKDEYCLPSIPNPAKLEKLKGKASIVLVRPSDKVSSWIDVDSSLGGETSSTTSPPAVSPPLTMASTIGSTKAQPPKDSICEVGLDLQDCKSNEECVAVQEKSRNGVCRCKEGFSKDQSNNGVCISVVSTTPPPPQKIVVNVVSKEIQLPVNQVKLTAFAVPEANAKTPYDYEWKLVSGPTKGTMENSHAQTLTLSNLEEGTYQFKLIVTGKSPPVEGEAFGNVTVLAARRVNTPPKAVVQPVSQIVNLPTTKAIIDGSTSTDDTTDLKFHWEILNGPVNYQKQLPDEPTLTLVDLVAGNYTLSLTVTDSDGLTDSTQAHLLVNEEIDYPPTANAGEDVILYLPNNEVDLHGNMSSDDHGIVGWEWTRASSPTGSKELAADTNNMRTPHPHLSNLEEGVYTFSLKVTDAKGQSDEDQVNVYVKPPISLPPTADAGHNQEISLPKTWVILDGSASKDDVQIASYLWAQVSGPNDAVFESTNVSKTNVTGLTKGKYVFKLKVTDDLGNAAESTVEVTVNQDTNLSPVADAGPDVIVTLPKSVLVVNGTGSHDDLKIVRYLWTRLPNSLAAGKIIGTSHTEPALLLVNLVPGIYVFQLQVWDEQGKSSKDTVSIKVKENPDHANILQALLNVELTDLVQSRLDGFCQSLGLLLRSDGSAVVRVLKLLEQKDTGFVILHFLVDESLANGTKVVLPGVDVVASLEAKLKASQDILDLKVLELDTLECQNPCSGHGQCLQATRTCICEPFWIENFVRRHLMDGKSNCDWSIIYVGIFLAISVAAIVCSASFVICKKKKKVRPRKRYTRLEQSDQDKIDFTRHTHTSSLMTSESDSEDDEIVFDDDLNRRTRASPTSLLPLKMPNGTPKKNGHAKLYQETTA